VHGYGYDLVYRFTHHLPHTLLVSRHEAADRSSRNG